MWRLSDKAICCFFKQRFQIILLDTSCENHQQGYKNMARLSILQFSHIQRVFDGEKHENIYDK
jgi:hypothetical protein